MTKKLGAEFIGTFWLVLGGCGAAVFAAGVPDVGIGYLGVAFAFGLAAASFFPIILLGIFDRRANKEGAIAGMIAGLGVTLLYVFQHKGIMFIQSTSYLGDMSPNWFFSIEPNAFGAVGAVVNFIVAFAVAKVTAPPPEHIQHLVEDIRVPHGAGTAVEPRACRAGAPSRSGRARCCRVTAACGCRRQ